jgi:hypothetical protein
MLSLLSALWLFAVFALAARFAAGRSALAHRNSRTRRRYAAFSSTAGS